MSATCWKTKFDGHLTTLNAWISKRGDAVHRSRPPTNGAAAPHLVKKEDLERLIRFVKDLVRTTDAFIESKA
jgi:hypothetical protein